jgi:Flp pilus assembly CpaF family ATPase
MDESIAKPSGPVINEKLASRWHARLNQAEGAAQAPRAVDLELSRDAWSAESMQAANKIEQALLDDRVSEIHANAHDKIFIKANGTNRPLGVRFTEVDEYNSFIEQLVVDSESVYSWAELKDRRSGVVKLHTGDAMTVIMPPISPELQIVVRKHNLHTVEPSFFVDNGTMTQHMMDFLQAATRAKVNMLIVGDVGSGKTTLLNMLTKSFDPNERVAIIEQVPELMCENENTAYWTYQPMATAETGTSLYDILDVALYSRIQRMIIGEIHDEGLTKMLKVMIKGSEGVFATYHAGDVKEAIERLKIDLQLENRNMSSQTALSLMQHSIQLIVVQGRVDGKHRTLEISEIDWRKTNDKADTIPRNKLFEWDQSKGAHVVGSSGPNEGGSVMQRFAKYRENMDPVWFYDEEQLKRFLRPRK